MILVLRDEHVREETRARHASLDRLGRKRCRDDVFLAARTGKLLTEVSPDEAAVLELLGDLLADLDEIPATAPTLRLALGDPALLRVARESLGKLPSAVLPGSRASRAS